MARYILRLAMLFVVTFSLPSGTSWARGAGSENGGQVEGTVRAVYKTQRLLVLTNGAEFRATDPRQLDPVQEGMMIKVNYMQTGDRKLINFIVVPAP
jgi:hypothetical protein